MENNNISDTNGRKNASDPHELRNALKWVLIWIAIAMAVMAVIFAVMGKQYAVEFLGGYVIEFSLSMDNLFVFMSIFTAFGVSEHARHRVLHWGIIGAVILRLLFIMLGVAVVEKFAWVLYIFGALLIYNGVKMMKDTDEEADPSDSRIMKIIRRIIPMSESFDGDRFITHLPDKTGSGKAVRMATPLLGVLLFIEFSDIIFAIDSVPAVFSISMHPIIIYSSNILAILGLRQLYFVLEYMARRFQYVKYGVGIILMFTGVKLLAVIFDVHLGTGLSICIIVGVLAAGIVLSMLISGRNINDRDR